MVSYLQKESGLVRHPALVAFAVLVPHVKLVSVKFSGGFVVQVEDIVDVRPECMFYLAMVLKTQPLVLEFLRTLFANYAFGCEFFL